ncbi:GntR family transcriptional regulator [Microbacterium rhizophilus]|uniref:GntR family transcriptional regulator n=1 Tax=Microbacterium rhizophilus TaxID=3138934 RepID=UPI0031EDFE77
MTLDFAAPLTNSGPRLSDLAFERLAQAIVDGVLAPGEPLRDHVLAQQLGVSRMPVREALQRLERVGLVETAASRYTRVTVFTTERIAAGIEYAGFLYGAATWMATTRMGDAQRAHAVALLDSLIAAPTNARGLLALRAFYLYVFAASGNEVLDRRSDIAYLVSRIARTVPVDELMKHVAGRARTLRDAVARGDAAGAETAVRRMHGIA